MRTSDLLAVLFVCFVLIVVGSTINPTTELGHSTTSSYITTTHLEDETLIEQIQSYANDHSIHPIDATIDRVWKAIPGYNGLLVDIDASFEKMWVNNRFDDNLVVYREVSPQVHLSGLPPSPIYRGNPEKPMATLLINVAWGNEFIPKILETLERRQVKATFFFDGSWVNNNRDLAKLIAKNGHEIGNHAYSHPDLKYKSLNETMNELKKTNDVIAETVGIRPIWFAPPSGSFNEDTVKIADQLGMYTILWTVDTVDWKKPSTSEMVHRVLSQVENGSMILMHPTKPVAEGLENMIDAIEKKVAVRNCVRINE